MISAPSGVQKRARRKAFFLIFTLTLVIVLAFTQGLAAEEEYSFEVPDEDIYVKVNQDSSLDFWYKIEFKNDEGAKPIDIIDVGMPTPDYSIAECSASINEVPLTDIRPSEVVSPGVEVHLGNQAIQPGNSAVFSFKGRTPQMVFQDTQHEGYASVEFINTWWDEQYAHGKTDLNFSIEFPPGVQPNETVYHGEEYSFHSDAGGAHVFTWDHADVKPSEGVIHGISFPALYVTGVYPQQPLPDYEPVGSSTYYYDAGSSSFGAIWKVIIPVILSVFAVLARSVRSGFRVHGEGAKVKYIAPAMSVEGSGPKTDLDASEASVLMCQDLDRVASIVFIELMQKGIITLKSMKPALFYKTAMAPEGLPPHYCDFLASITPEGSIDEATLKMALTMLLKRVEKKTRGFCHEDTVKYYEEAAKNAWIEVKSQADRDQKLAKFNDRLDFLLLDPAFNSRLRDTFSSGTYTVPLWISSLVALQGGGCAKEPGQAGGRSAVEGATIADSIAATFKGVQDSAFAVTEDMKEEIVKEVNPVEYRRVYRDRYYGRRTGIGGGGGGCACACACAGCA
ncbi:MAG: hypothetical protein JXA49_08050, partial [Actinobacteria bacterium]|nr:hypothetical protein [Actinomycetota bacterium]